MDYHEFLQGKLKINHPSGFAVPESCIHPVLFDFQNYCVRKALLCGKFALFEECGLGKTLQQVEWAKQIVNHTNGSVLILCPLAVAGQTMEQARNLMQYEVKRFELGLALQPGIYITNYEQLDNIDPSLFTGIVLDESSILKNFNGATKKKLIEGFAQTPYKLCCTATPSPNDDTEITNHAEFLNQGKTNEILAMYFTHDGGDTGQWRLKGHARKRFWNWVKTWSVFVSNPSDLGFDGRKFILPPLNLIDMEVKVPTSDYNLFNNISINATNFNSELRATQKQRIAEVINILESKPTEQFIVWLKQNGEADYLCDHLQNEDFREVRGSDAPEDKEKNLLDFAHGRYRILVTKTKIAQFGLNFQNCHNQIFAALDFSFEGTYQAIRRSYRFGQQQEVNIYMITTDTMQNVIGAIRQKEQQFQTMKTHLLYAN